MTIAIVSAMQEEIDYLLGKMDNCDVVHHHNYTFYRSKFKSLDLIICKSGIGKTAAGMLMGCLVSNFKVDKIINTGICGGRFGYSNLGDIIVMDKALYGDVDLEALGCYKYGQVPSYPEAFKSDRELFNLSTNCLKGDLLTSDIFATSKERMEEIINSKFNNYNILGFDMESAAFSQGAYYFNIPFIAIRATSDVVGVSTSKQYQDNEINLCQVSSKYLISYLDSLDSYLNKKDK